MREIRYGQWHVEASARKIASGEWSPQALLWRHMPDATEQFILPKRDQPHPTFSSREKAEQHAATLARAWVDENG